MEFDLIACLRDHLPLARSDSLLGIGDDGALLRTERGVVAVTDTLVSGVHFFPDTPAADLGWKSLAVNLSDLAAMGAQPAWALLNLTLPAAWPAAQRSAFVCHFAHGFGELAQQYELDLVGGDTTSGPLAITVTALGLPPTRLLTRRGARAGDLIVVSGTLGDAARACQCGYRGEPVARALQQRMRRPQPRVALGYAIAPLARCGLDISDGLLADLNHLLGGGPDNALDHRGGAELGADLQLTALPTSAALSDAVADPEQRWPLQLGGGDDYELLFLLAPQHADQLPALAAAGEVALNVIGEVSATPGIRCWQPDGGLFTPPHGGFRHFHNSNQGLA